MTLYQARLLFIGLISLLFISASIAVNIGREKPTDIADWIRIICWALASGVVGFIAGAVIAADSSDA